MVRRSCERHRSTLRLLIVGPITLVVCFGASALSQTAYEPGAVQPSELFHLPMPQIVGKGQPLVCDAYLCGARFLRSVSFARRFVPQLARVSNPELGSLLVSTGRHTEVVTRDIDNGFGTLRPEAQGDGSAPGPRTLGRQAALGGWTQGTGQGSREFTSAVLLDRRRAGMAPPLFEAGNVVLTSAKSPTPTRTATGTPQASSPTLTPTSTPKHTPSGSKVSYLPIVQKSVVKLTNPSFETGTFAGWAQGGVLGQFVVERLHNHELPYSGNFCALLGDPDWRCRGGVPVGAAAITQTLYVPEVKDPRVELRYRFFSQDFSSQEQWRDFDRFEVRINGQTQKWWANLAASYGCESPIYDSGWRDWTVPLNEYRGQMIHLSLANVNHPDKWYNTWTYVDDIAIGWDLQ